MSHYIRNWTAKSPVNHIVFLKMLLCNSSSILKLWELWLRNVCCRRHTLKPHRPHVGHKVLKDSFSIFAVHIADLMLWLQFLFISLVTIGMIIKGKKQEVFRVCRCVWWVRALFVHTKGEVVLWIFLVLWEVQYLSTDTKRILFLISFLDQYEHVCLQNPILSLNLKCCLNTSCCTRTLLRLNSLRLAKLTFKSRPGWSQDE